MSEESFQEVNEIVAVGDKWFFLQSLRNDPDEHTYVGYRCKGEEDKTPAEGHQPGQCYLASGTASLENLVSDLTGKL